MLKPEASRQRQRRMLDRINELRLDAVVLGLPAHVYYFSAFLTAPLHQSAFVLLADGRSWLVTANVPPVDAAADNLASYEAQWNSTQRPDQPAIVGRMVAGILRSHAASRVGIDTSLVTCQFGLYSDAELQSVDPIIWQLRRVKDPDEMDLMRQAIRCTEAMYARAREIIEPGIEELRVFAELHSAAVQAAGEPLTCLLGNDFRCASRGGAARGNRPAQAGEIYILDLGPCYRGYFADNARSFAVNGKPTDAQYRAWQALAKVFGIVQRLIRPGARCQDLYRAVDDHFQKSLGTALPHHLGHGVGLQPHEFPHLNPAWDDVLLEGEVFTVEPGFYCEELAGGIRLENQYRVTATGCENLVNFPLALVW